VPGIWFPFGIGVSRTQYLLAIFIPLLAVLVVRTVHAPGPGVPAARAAERVGARAPTRRP
jgi:hypothetical protein